MPGMTRDMPSRAWEPYDRVEPGTARETAVEVPVQNTALPGRKVYAPDAAGAFKISHAAGLASG